MAVGHLCLHVCRSAGLCVVAAWDLLSGMGGRGADWCDRVLRIIFRQRTSFSVSRIRTLADPHGCTRFSFGLRSGCQCNSDGVLSFQSGRTDHAVSHSDSEPGEVDRAFHRRHRNRLPAAQPFRAFLFYSLAGIGRGIPLVYGLLYAPDDGWGLGTVLWFAELILPMETAPRRPQI